MSNRIKIVNEFVNSVREWYKGQRKKGQYYHKIFLIMSFADLVAYGLNEGNKIYLDNNLEQTFRHYWENYESSVPYNPSRTIMMPLCRLQKNGIWELENSEIKENHSFNPPRRRGEYGYLSWEWVYFFQRQDLREAFKKNLIDIYFRPSLELYKTQEINKNSDLKRVQRKVLNKEAPTPDEIHLRSVAFRQTINEEYNFSCCVSGSQVKASKYSLIEAAHIVDFSIDQNDSIDNGIALNPLLHKAFDAGFFTIHKNGPDHYQLEISEHLEENQNSSFNLKQYHKSFIDLPDKKEYYPNEEYLKWHQEHQFERFLK
jgi:putative restriction endonuclease